MHYESLSAVEAAAGSGEDEPLPEEAEDDEGTLLLPLADAAVYSLSALAVHGLTGSLSFEYSLRPQHAPNSAVPFRRRAADFHALRARLRAFCPGAWLSPEPRLLRFTHSLPPYRQASSCRRCRTPPLSPAGVAGPASPVGA